MKIPGRNRRPDSAGPPSPPAGLRPRPWHRAYGGRISDPARERTFRGWMMRASFENTQCGAVASEHAGTGVDRDACADCRNNQSEDRDALGTSARRRLSRERGSPQDAVRKMKVAKPIDIEFLQTERLQDSFVFHSRRPAHKVMNHPATTGACRTVNYFCGLLRNRNYERNEK